MNQDYSSPLPGGLEKVRQGFTGRWFWLAVFVAATLVLLFGSYTYYRHETERIRQEKYDDIAAIARLKAGHIQQWRKSLLRDVRALSTGPMFKREVGEWLRNPDDNALRTLLRDRLANETGQGEFADALLVDRDGNVLLSASDSPQPLTVQEKKAAQEALAKRSPCLSSAYRTPQGTIIISAIAPVVNAEGAAIAAGMLRCNLESELFPLVQTWPTPSKTAETLLVRKEDGSVLFLNNLRHRPDTALTLRDPLTKEDLPAVQAVLGKRGMFAGKDYRGHEVLADLSRIPDSPWFMVSKVDTSEIMQEVRYRGGVIFIFSVLFILLAASATAFGYRHRQVGLYKKLYRSERQQRVAQEEFRTTLYSIGDAVISTDTAGIVKQMNPVAEHLTGWEEPEAKGKPLEEVFHIISEESRLPAENPVSRVLRDGMIVGLANHTLLISKHGNEYPVADSGAPIRDEKGVILGVVLVFRDQTDERKSQRELEEKERLLRETGRMARVGGWELDADSLEVRWTEETYRIHEVPLDYKTPLEEAINFFHSDDRAKLRQAIQNALQLGDAYDMEIRFITATGKQLWTRTICQPEIVDGKVVKLKGTFQDITERKQAEEALRGSEERYRSLFEQAKRQEQLYLSLLDCSADPIVVYDLEGKVRYLNAAHTNLFGWTLEEAKGKRLNTLPEKDRVATLSIINQIVSQGAVNRAYGTQRLTKEGRSVDVSVSGARYLDDQGNPAGMVVILHDITDLKQTEKALRESERRRRLALDAARAGAWEWDLRTNENIWSEELWALYGLEPHSCEPSYEAWLRTIHPDDRAEAEQAVRRAASNRTELNAEWRTNPSTGRPRWVMSRGQPVHDEHGQVASYLGIVVDITERKKTEDALRESEARFKHVFESANVGKSVTLLTGEISVNKAFCDMLGYSEHELRNTTWQEHTPPEEVGPVQEMLDQLVKGEKDSVRFNKRYIHKNGSYIWADVSVVIRRDHGGKPLHFITTAVDITERKRAEEALRESEQRYRAVVDNLQIGISVINRDMEIIAVNPFFHRHYPHVRPLEGQLCHEMYNDPPSTSPCSYCPCIQTFQDGLVHESVTETPAGGRIRNYRLVSCPVKDGQGNVDLVIELVEDITERRSLQAQLAQAQKMEAVGTLAGGVAHDFNNVLQVALGFSELILGDEELPQHYRTDLLKINEAAMRGADLVQRLLTFSRKTEIKPQPLDLNVRITELRKMLERTLPKMVDIQLVQDVKLAKINADKTHIDQVLMNLAVNARDAMPDGGKLSFETANVTLDEEYAGTNPEANPGPHVLLTVTDTGMGIDKDTLEHIFEPFYTTKGVGEGTGLGLAMVHGIVNQHGGHIRCYSEPGHGTTFKIYFPALLEDEEPEERALRVMPQGGCETILLVDDEELIRDLGSRILTKAGYKVITSSDGEEALTIYQRRTDEISLVVLDVIMPVMGGKQCIEALLRLNPSIKVVIASGLSTNGPVNDALSAGARGFVNKPYDMRQMLEVVREVLDAE